MKKTILLISLLFLSTPLFAGTVNVPTTYANGGTVTASNLNGNFDALESTLNGGLDNNNADTTSGYRFFETRATLPSAGSQGRTVFLTSDDSLNLDTGSAWAKTITITSPVNGDIAYYNSGWNRLPIGSAGQALTVSSSLPAWEGGSVPVGGIIMWSGTIASIPTGWELSDGSCSITCPDLTNRFIVGADADDGGVAKSTVTGSALQTSDGQIPAHTHTYATSEDGGAGTAYAEGTDVLTSGGTPATSSTGTGTKNIATFYALAFIIRVN